METISRNEAKRLGLKRYFTGKPCVHGHVSERLVYNHTCVECARDYARSNTKAGSKPTHKTIKMRIPIEHEALVRQFVKDVRKL